MFLRKNFTFNRKRLQSFANIAIKSPVSVNPERKGYWQYFKGIVDDFVEITTIPGLDRIFKSNLNIFKRLLWLSGFIAAVIILAHITSVLLGYLETTPMITVVSDTHYPVFKIPFPEITICNKNRLNWQRYESAKDKFLKSQHQSNEYEDIFMDVLNAYDTLSFGDFNKFENLTKFPKRHLQELNYINFTVIVEYMAWKCYEILAECKWISREINCCEIFFKRNSQMGPCLAFNSVESTEGREKKLLDRYWPWRSNGMGLDYGLTVRVYNHEHLHSPKSTNAKGILFMLIEPNVWYEKPVEIDSHTRTTVAFSGILHFYDEYTRHYSSEVRRCVFQDELHSVFYKSLYNHVYMFENCLSECQQEYLIEYCNCSMDLFYPPGQHRPCKLVDLPCLSEHNDQLQYFEQIGEGDFVHDNQQVVMKCNCYNNCQILTYVTNVNAANMSNVKVDINNTFVDISFYFKTDRVLVYKTIVKYTWTDLLAGLGGLAGLCIGCSLISVIEIFYFFLVDIPKKTYSYYKTEKYLRLHRKSQDIKIHFIKDVHIWTK